MDEQGNNEFETEEPTLIQRAPRAAWDDTERQWMQLGATRRAVRQSSQSSQESA